MNEFKKPVIMDAASGIPLIERRRHGEKDEENDESPNDIRGPAFSLI